MNRDIAEIAQYDFSPSGALRVRGFIARRGWLEYRHADGSTHWEYVPDETLFDPEHLDSIGGAIVTLGHPDELVTPENYREHTVGNVGEKVIAHVGKGLIEVTFFINDAKAIDSIQKGRTKQLSMGYLATTEPIPNKDGYFKQTKRIANHIALVTTARGGDNLSLKMDGVDYCVHSDTPDLIEDKKTMANYTRDGVSLDIATEAIPIIKSWLETADGNVATAQKELLAARNEINSLKADSNKEIEVLQARLDVAQKQIEEIKAKPIRLDAKQLAERRHLERHAQKFIKNCDDEMLDALSDRQIKEQIIKNRFKFDDAYFTGKVDEAINAMFDAAVATEPERVDSTQLFKNDLRDLKPTNDHDKMVTEYEAMYSQSIENAWQNSLKGGK